MTITRVSVDSVGNQTNEISFRSSISGDGRFVAFDSFASNLVPGDTNNNNDIFVRDLLTNTTTRVSVDSAGNQGNSPSFSPSISGDGRFVAFASLASNLVPGDTNNKSDIFVRDLLTNTTTRVSVDLAGNQRNDSFLPGSLGTSITPNGRFVTFSSNLINLVPGDTNNNDDLFVRDLLTNTITRISVGSAGNQANSYSFSSSISADGRFVTFSSNATNLVPGDTNNSDDIFVRDLLTNTTTRISVDSTGNQANNASFTSSISGNGRFVIFTSSASNLVQGDTNNSTDLFVRDLLTNATTRVSISTETDNESNGISVSFSISENGRFLAFLSSATNLVQGDTNNYQDIFVAEIGNNLGDINAPFDNSINGTKGNNNMIGTSGNDIISSFDGDDALNGLRGNDLLLGGSGSDNLFGGKGFDTLNGGLENDNLVGGAGNDLFILGAGLGIDTISDFTNSQDTLQLIGGLTFGQLSISAGSNGTLIKVATSGEILAALTGVDFNSIGPEDFLSF